MSARLESSPTRSLPQVVGLLLLVLLLLVPLLVPVPPASAAECEDCEHPTEGGAPVVAAPSCVPTPGVSPITTISVACSANRRTKVQLEAFKTPGLNTIGSVLRVFVWQEQSGIVGPGGPGWVEVPAPGSSRIENTFFDVRVNGRVVRSQDSQVCIGRETVYTGFVVPQFQCFTWGFVLTFGTSDETANGAPALSLSDLGLSTDVAVGTRVISRAATVIDGQEFRLGPVTNA